MSNNITMAKFGQKLDDYINHSNSIINAIKENQDKCTEAVTEIKTILVRGSEKIKNTRIDFNNHMEEHKEDNRNKFKVYSLIIGICTVVSTVIGVIVSISLS